MRKMRPGPQYVGGVVVALAVAMPSMDAFGLGTPMQLAAAGTAAIDRYAMADGALRDKVHAAPAYDSITFAQPANDSTVFDNVGNVDVTVSVSPALRTGAGDRIALVLDGRQVATRSATQVRLSGITRGGHTLEARVVDSSGNALIASNPVRFYLWQASRLFPVRSHR
jgi:hypothetical protein